MKLKDLIKEPPVVKKEDLKKHNPPEPNFKNNSDNEKYKAPWKKYEVRVFDFLSKKKKALGIKEIRRFKNLLVDGALILDDDTCLLLEIKYVLGWLKACNARIQFEQFVCDPEYYGKAEISEPEGGVLIFNKFNEDWGAIPIKLNFKQGWREYYNAEEHLRKSLRVKTSLIQIDDKENAFIFVKGETRKLC
ncbi:hypothetical protein ACFLRC_03635 [Candidatus Altiarchaeota archaeon]